MWEDDVVVPNPEPERSDSERRIDNLGREAFQLAVTAATKAATQEVAQIHRRRLVTQSALAAGLVTLLIGLGAAYGLFLSQSRADHANAVYNCRLVRNLSLPLADFVKTDAHLRARQATLGRSEVTAGFSKLFGKTLLAKLYRESDALDRRAVDHWLHVVYPELLTVGAADCAASIQ